MQNPITPDIVVAYTQCPRKAFLLLCTDERGTPHDYAQMLARRQRMNETNYVASLKQQHPEARSYQGQIPDTGQGPLLEARLRAHDLEARCAVLTPVKRGTAVRGHIYEPTIAVGTYTIDQEQRLELQFVGHVLGQLQGALPPAGAIVGLDEQPKRVSLDKDYTRLEPIIGTLRAWTLAQPTEPPVILNQHCPECPFRKTCTAKAEHDDDLSLLERMTPKERQRYHDRGIFTVRQLSYLFRPRKERKHAQNTPVQHRLELQALALRTGKTYLHELPALDRQPVELFLDIEGVPDQHLYYLIGLLVCEEGRASYEAFWANTAEDEAGIWQQLLAKLGEYPDAPVYHYGSYEPRAFAALAKRYGSVSESVTKHLVNINTSVYGKVCFPVRSNRLKDLGRFLRVPWTSPDASGLQSLVWRQAWEDTQEDAYKQTLLTYNQEDCTALRALTDELTRLRDLAASEDSIDFAAHPKRHATDTGEHLHRHLEAIVRSAHASYEKAKISFRQDIRAEPSEPKRRGGRKGHQGYRRIIPKPSRVVRLPHRGDCPRCTNSPLQAVKRKIADKTIIDLVFTKNGCRKTITQYVGPFGYCWRCRRQYPPLAISGFGHRLFGHGFQAWVMYQRLVLRLPYSAIIQAAEEQFGESVSEGAIIDFVRDLARYYASAEERGRQRLLSSPFVHVDETKINMHGVDHYVWVFTDGRHVLFKLTKTRESTIVREVLDGYQGILISDFYGGYDAINCRQQKCLVHLIRDLNDDLWRAPFDTEFESFVSRVKNLLVPILEAVDRYGLKKRNLGKFRRQVEDFYKAAIADRTYKSPLVQTYQKRFKRYRQSMFTFLEYDGIPWNNNMAERAIRHLAIQRKISQNFYEGVTPQYLLLLGIAQTCRFQDKSLLKFLLSGEEDVDEFRAAKRVSSSIAVGPSTSKG